MSFLSESAEQEIVDRVVDAVFKALEINEESTSEKQRYLQPKQAVIYANVSVQTLNKWVLEMGLPQAKVGGVVLYDTNDLDEFIAKYKV